MCRWFANSPRVRTCTTPRRHAPPNAVIAACTRWTGTGWTLTAPGNLCVRFVHDTGGNKIAGGEKTSPGAFQKLRPPAHSSAPLPPQSSKMGVCCPRAECRKCVCARAMVKKVCSSCPRHTHACTRAGVCRLCCWFANRSLACTRTTPRRHAPQVRLLLKTR